MTLRKIQEKDGEKARYKILYSLRICLSMYVNVNREVGKYIKDWMVIL